jgi:spermidine/putrescine transport system permease protein
MTVLRRVRRWCGKNLVLGLGLLILAYTFVPIAIVVLMSFNDSSRSRNVYKFQEFTLEHWLHPGGWADGMAGSVLLSVQIALLATVVATILGTLAAFALVRHRFVGRSSANLIIFLPMASPEIVMGSSLLALFVSTSVIPLGFWTILIAHIMFCLSFVIVTVKARLSGLNDNLEQAAMDLYATESQTFWRVTFPLVLPGIVGAALLAFSLSFDDFIITNLNSGQEVTFPMFVYGANQRGVPMEVNVIGTAMFVISIVIVLGNEVVRRRQQKALTG